MSPSAPTPESPDSDQVAAVFEWLAEKPTSTRTGQAVRRLEELQATGAIAFREVRLGYLRNFTVEPIEANLKLEGFRAGLQILPTYSGYAPQPGAELAEQTASADVVVVGLRLEELSSTLAADFLVAPAEQINELAAAAVDQVLTMVDAARSSGSAPVIVHNFVPPLTPAAGLADSQDAAGQVNLVRQANLDLAAAVAEREGVWLLDVEHVFSLVGLRACYDPRGDRMSGAPLS